METIHVFFFFQAEDGIRDKLVTGVQTCALPISNLQQAAATMASAQAASVQAKANLDQSERALRRTKELHTQSPNLISTEQLEQAQTAFDIAEANLNAAQHQVDQARAAVQSARDNLRKTT